MFYAAQLVSRDGPLQVLWVAATLDRQLNRQLVDGTAIPKVVEVYLAPDAPAGIFSSGPSPSGQQGRRGKTGRGKDGGESAPLALRLSGQLLLGVCRIYSRKVSYLLQDCEKALLVLRNICPDDAPMAYGDDAEDEETSGGSRGHPRTRQADGTQRAAAADGEGGEAGPSRRGVKARRRATVPAGAAGGGIGPDGEPQVLLYDEDEILLAGSGGSQELRLPRADSGASAGAADLLLRSASGLLGERTASGVEDGLGLTTPLGSSRTWGDPRGLRDPWSTPWAGAAGTNGLLTDPHPAATEDRHAYFDDEMPDHFEFDLDEHEIEALRAASQELGHARPAQRQQPPANDPFSTPQQQQRQPDPDRDEAPRGAEGPGPSEHQQGEAGPSQSALGQGELFAGEDPEGKMEAGLEAEGPRSPTKTQSATAARTAASGLTGGYAATGGWTEGDAAEEHEQWGDAQDEGQPQDDGGSGAVRREPDQQELQDGEQQQAQNELPSTAGGAAAGSRSARADSDDAPMQDVEQHQHDGGSGDVGGSIPGGSLADPETLPRGGTSAVDGDGGAAAAAAVATPPRGAAPAVVLPAEGGTAARGEAETPLGSTRRQSAGPATPRVALDVEKDGRVKTTLPSHAVRELLQDRTPLIDHRRRNTLRRSAAAAVPAAALFLDASGSPWLATWGRLLCDPASTAATAATAVSIRASAGAGAGRGGGAGAAAGRGRHANRYLAFDAVPGHAGRLETALCLQQPLAVASGPAALPAAALAPALRHLYRFLAGPAGGDYCAELRGHRSGDDEGEDEDEGRAGSARSGEGAPGADKEAGAAKRAAGSKRPRDAAAAAAAATAGAEEDEATRATTGASHGNDAGGQVEDGATSADTGSGYGGHGGGCGGADSSQRTVPAAGRSVPGEVEAGNVAGEVGEDDAGASVDLGPPGRSAGAGGKDAAMADADPSDALSYEGETERRVRGGEGEPLERTGRGPAGEVAAEQEEMVEEEEEDDEDELETQEDSELREEEAWVTGDEEAAKGECGEAGAGSGGQGGRRSRHASDGFTARTQAVLKKLQSMALAVRSSQQQPAGGRDKSAKRRRMEATPASGGPLQVTTAAELLLAVADLADPSAGARRRAAAGTPGRPTPARPQPRVGHASAGATPEEDGEEDVLASRVSRMAAARTFYDLLVLSNRGFITLTAQPPGALGPASPSQGSERPSQGTRRTDAAEVGTPAGGSAIRGRASSTGPESSGPGSVRTKGRTPGGVSGGATSTGGIGSPEGLVVVARRRLEAAAQLGEQAAGAQAAGGAQRLS